ncbi:MAG: hypothetical protein Q9M97_08525 [Candidatus Gracilibacteria bacterium]|nr:hypothetical protein [Candidatus Gracilibacteria bacterium]
MNKIGKYRLRLYDCLSNSKKTWKHLFFGSTQHIFMQEYPN